MPEPTTLSPRTRRALSAVPAVLVALPALFGAVGLARARWLPDLDDAAITYRVQRVLALHPPLVGMPSTLQGDVIGPHLTTNHPGPLLFWLLAPVYALFGRAGIGIAAGAALLNGLAAVASVVFAHRRRGPGLAALVGIALLLLERTLSTDLLASPFNPYASIIPLFLLVVLTWSVAAGDRAAYVPFVLAATLVAQSHLSGVVPAATLFTIGTVAAAAGDGRGRRLRTALGRRPDDHRPAPTAFDAGGPPPGDDPGAAPPDAGTAGGASPRLAPRRRAGRGPGSRAGAPAAHAGRRGAWSAKWRSAGTEAGGRRRRAAWSAPAAAAVLLLVWLPVLVDELVGGHNLTNLWRATHGRGASVGLGFAAAELGRTIGLPPAFALGQHRGTTLAVALPVASVVVAGVVIVALLVMAATRRWWGEVGLVGAALAALAGCVLQTARLPASSINRAPYGFTVWHVRYWILPLGAVLWAGAAWIAARLLARLVGPRRTSRRAAVVAPAVGALACLVVAIVLPPRPAVWRAGARQQSAIVARLTDQVAAALPRSGTYLAQVTVYDAPTFGGVMAALSARGYRLVVPDDTAYYWAPGAGCRRAAVTGVLTFATGAAAAPSADRRGTRTIARTAGDPGPSVRLGRLVAELDRRLGRLGGVHYRPAAAHRFLQSFPGPITAADRRQLLPPIRRLAGFDIVTLLELSDAGVLDEPSLVPVLRDLERAGARYYSAFGPLSRAAVRLAPASAAVGCGR